MTEDINGNKKRKESKQINGEIMMGDGKKVKERSIIDNIWVLPV